MTTNEPEIDLAADLLPRLAAAVKTLRDSAKDDPDLLVHIGALASNIVQKGGKKNWQQFKSALSTEAYDGLLQECQTKSVALAKDGDSKSAYAVEVIATSIIASRIDDTKINGGNELLDDLINRSARAYNTAKLASN